MKQLSLTQAQAKLGKLIVEVEKRKRPIAITQGSKIKAVLVSAGWYSRVTEESAHYRRATKQSPLELRGSMTLIGDINQDSKKLGKKEKNLWKESSPGLSNSPLSFPSLCWKKRHVWSKKKVVRLAVPFRRWAEELDRSPNFQVQAYTIEILLKSVALVAIRDPADRAIVATARHLRCPLITADEVIQDGKWVDTVWE